MGNSFGSLFRVTTWGESHGGAVGAVIDGCPPRLALAEADIQPQLDRRRPGQSRLTTPRQESDTVRILSGVFEGRTLGTPILLWVANEDPRPGAYEALRDLYRPSHADYTYEAKYGLRNWQGGGRAFALERVGRGAAGAVAAKILRLGAPLEVVAWVRSVGGIEARLPSLEETGRAGRDESRAGSEGGAVVDARPEEGLEPASLTREQVDASDVRCPDPDAAARMIEAIDQARREGDSLGGVIEGVVRGVPWERGVVPGLGEPVFDKLEADLARAMLGIPACTGFQIGSGFDATSRRGSRNNDAFRPLAPEPGGAPFAAVTNRSGGIQGGISNGEVIWFRVAFKPTATIRHPQETVDRAGRSVTLAAQGRHDPCVLPRAVPIVEAMTELVLVDHWLRQIALSEASARIEGRACGGREGDDV